MRAFSFLVVLIVAAGPLPAATAENALDVAQRAARAGDREAAIATLSDFVGPPALVDAERPGISAAVLELLQLYTTEQRWEDLAELAEEWGVALARREGLDLPAELQRLSLIALAYQQTGRFDELEHVLLRSIELQLGAEEPNARTLSNQMSRLAHLILRRRPDDPEARFWMDRAVANQEAALGADSVEVASILKTAGHFYRRLRDYETAVDLWLRSDRLIAGSGPPELTWRRRDLARGLAGGLRYLGRKEEALEHSLRDVELTERLRGPTHPDLLFSLGGAVSLLVVLDRAEEAEPLAVRALEIAETSWGVESTRARSARRALANVMQQLGRDRTAANLRHELARNEQRSPRLEPSARGAEWNRAAFVESEAAAAERRGELDAAEELYRDALTLRREVVSDATWELAMTHERLAGVYSAQARDEEAREQHTRAIQTMEQALGPDHQQTAYRLYAAGKFCRATRRPEEAVALLERSVAIRDELGQADPALIGALAALAGALDTLERHDDATATRWRVVAEWDRISGPESVDARQTIYVIGSHHLARKEYPRAEAALIELVGRLERSGREDGFAVRILRQLGDLYQATERDDLAREMFVRAFELEQSLLEPGSPEQEAARRAHASRMRELDRQR